MANIHVSWLNPYKVRRITLVCSKKMIVYDDIDENKITIYDKGIDRMHVIGQNMDYDKINMIQFSYRSGDIHIPQIKWEEPLKVEIKHFIDCITKGVDCLTGIAHTKKVVRILSMATQ